MELNQAFIDSLLVNEVDIMKRIAEALSVRVNQVSAVVGLTKEGCTVPFISRYRKEATGSLDEVQVRDVTHQFSSGVNLEERRIEIIKAIFAQGKLGEELYGNLRRCATLTELEDIYAPYKKKKKTRGMLAEEKGLGPLADYMMEDHDDESLRAKAREFLRTVEQAVAERSEGDKKLPAEEAALLAVPTIQEALQGAMDIIAERVSQDVDNRAELKAFYAKTASLHVTGVGDEEKAKTSVYKMYWDYSEGLGDIKPHRVLAINRGEREGALETRIEADDETGANLIANRYRAHNTYHSDAVRDGAVRLLSPAVIRELRSDNADGADSHGIDVFSENLKNLLMSPPIKGTRVLGIDPGIRTGTKCAAMDETGKFLGYFLIRQDKVEESKKAILEAMKTYKIGLVAVGNGTGSREVQEVVAALLSEGKVEAMYTVVDEDGASVYSASDIAREEFPELDLTIRGAISIGRRLQDPLAELVKIDPQSIGVGLYQHDLNQKKLSDSLDEVVGSVVNNVGVNINTASHALLKYVSGINASLAKKIVKYRDERGKIVSRDELKTVPGMGPKSYEQCAGFLKIPESANPLDNSWVHPENYLLATELVETAKTGASVPQQKRAELKEKYSVGDTTIDDILNELKKPNRDPREDLPKPLMRKDVVNFEDLAEGMLLAGKIKNVVDFGAFVDLGLKETALLHVSEMSDNFVKDPMELFKVGDVREFRIIGLDLDRRRISVSLKSPGAPAGAARGSASQGGAAQGNAARSSGLPGAKPSSGSRPTPASRPAQGGRPAKEDDGMSYNPFAEALKKMKK